MSIILDVAKQILNNGDVAFFSYYLLNISKIIDNYLEMYDNINELMIYKLKKDAEYVVDEFIDKTIIILSSITKNYKEENQDIIIQDEEIICNRINDIKLFTSNLKLEMVYKNSQLKDEFLLLQEYIIINSNMFVGLHITVKNGGDYSCYVDKLKGNLVSFKKCIIKNTNLILNTTKKTIRDCGIFI